MCTPAIARRRGSTSSGPPTTSSTPARATARLCRWNAPTQTERQALVPRPRGLDRDEGAVPAGDQALAVAQGGDAPARELGVHRPAGPRAQRTHDEPIGAVGADRQLLLGDRRLGVAEELGVLEGHVGQDHGRLRLQDVGRVPAPAEPGLDRHRLHPAAAEGPERDGGERLELRDRIARRQRRAVCGAAHGRRRLGERVVTERRPAELDPLGPVVDVRRQVGARPQALARQRRRREARRRGLAVRADHVHRRGAALRVAERAEQRADALEAQAHPEDLEPGDPLAGLPWAHALSPAPRSAR